MNRILLFCLLFSAACAAQPGTPVSDALLHQAGTVRFDIDGDGCSADDRAAAIRLRLQNEQGVNYTFSDTQTAAFTSASGSLIITPQPEDDYFFISPTSVAIDENNADAVNFCLTPNGFRRDAEVMLLPSSQAMIGAESVYRVLVRNKGNQTLNGIVNFSYPTQTTLISAEPLPHHVTASTMNWSCDELRPFDSRIYTVTLRTKTPSDAQPVNPGDELIFSANMPVEDDETPQDNSSGIKLTAMSSFEPNNKYCLQGSVLPASMIGQYLNYVINFENTTSSTVQKIVVYDEIDTSRFEISSFQITGMSHAGIPVVLGNKVEVYFQNVNLAPGGQGFVTFKLKTKGTLAVGSTVINKAKIYFDFNFPIDTNIATTTFQELGVSSVSVTPDARIYPNPAVGFVTIEANEDIRLVTLMDAQGRRIAGFTGDGPMLNQDFSAYLSGVYCLRIDTASGTVVRKLVKQ